MPIGQTEEQRRATFAAAGQQPVIDSASLAPSTPITLPPTTTISNPQTTDVSIPTPEAIINETSAPTAAENQQSSILNSIADLVGSNTGLESLKSQKQNEMGVPQITSTLNDLNTQLEGLNNQSTALQNESNYTIPNQMQQSAEGRLVTSGGLASQTASALRLNQIKQGAIASQSLTLKSAIYGAQGKYNIAKDAADKAAQIQFDAEQRKIDAARARLDAIAPQLTRDQAKRAALQQAKLDERQRNLDNAKEDKKTAIAMATAALKNFPQDAAAQYAAQQALAESNKDQPNIQKIFNLIGKYQADPVAIQKAITDLAISREELRQAPIAFAADQALRRAQIASANRANQQDSPTVKTINGVDMQWNPKTQTWDSIGSGAASGVNTQKTLDQIALTKGSLANAKKLAGASGRSGARKGVESFTVGATDYTNLVAETNTLRTNMLIMSTDPNIKKFFGPQMSNADVQLMTSAGTTLNPELQTPEFMRAELARMTDLVDRAEKAVAQGMAGQAGNEDTQVVNGVTYKKAADGLYYPQ